MVDTNPMDPTSDRPQPIHAPAAPLSAEEIAEMRDRLNAALSGAVYGTMDRIALAHCVGPLVGKDMPRLLDALEALTAENARMTAEAEQVKTALVDPQAVHLGMLSGGIAKPSLRNMLHLNGDNALKIWDEAVECRIELAGVQAERDRLKAEVERLTAELREERAQCLADLGQAMQPECYAAGPHGQLPGNSGDVGWYARHRAAVEAAYLVDLQARCQNCRGGKLNHVAWPDIHVCPMCHRDCRPAAQLDDATQPTETAR